MKKDYMDNRGFSLVELIIVIAVMAVLIGVVGSQVIPYLNSSRRAKDVQIISSYGTASVAAYASHPDDAPTSGKMKITIESNSGQDKFTCDVSAAQNIADELKNLISSNHVTNAAKDFESRDFKATKKIVVEYDFDAREISVVAYDDAGAEINPEDKVFGRL